MAVLIAITRIAVLTSECSSQTICRLGSARIC